jgi:hypothetical protein
VAREPPTLAKTPQVDPVTSLSNSIADNLSDSINRSAENGAHD